MIRDFQLTFPDSTDFDAQPFSYLTPFLSNNIGSAAGTNKVENSAPTRKVVSSEDSADVSLSSPISSERYNAPRDDTFVTASSTLDTQSPDMAGPGDGVFNLIMPLASTSFFNVEELRSRFKSDVVRSAMKSVSDLRRQPSSDMSFGDDGDTISVNSFYYDAASAAGLGPLLYNAMPVEMDKEMVAGDSEKENENRPQSPYVGFPPELLETTRSSEPGVALYSSKTMPHRLTHRSSGCSAESKQLHDIRPRRDRSFQDDRALLPSQRHKSDAPRRGVSLTTPQTVYTWPSI